MWQDMNLYWAWRGQGAPTCEPPFPKIVSYIDYGHMGKLANTVVEGSGVDEKTRDVFVEEHVKKREHFSNWMKDQR